MSLEGATDHKVAGASIDGSTRLTNNNENNPPNGSGNNPEKYRLDAIRRRKLRSIDLVKLRKRKLAELYFVTKSPFIPISDQKLSENETNLLMFLDRNDLEKGHRFDINSLPQPPISRPSSMSLASQQKYNTTPTAKKVPLTRQQGQLTPATRQPIAPCTNVGASNKKPSPPLPPQQQKSASQQLTPSTSSISPPVQLSLKQTPTLTTRHASPVGSEEEPPHKMQKLDQGDSKGDSSAKDQQHQQTQPQSQQQLVQHHSHTNQIIPALEVPIQEIYPIAPIPLDYKPSPTLSTLIQAYAESKAPELSEKELLEAKRELDIANIDINKLSVLLMPGNLPSQIPESSPLAELYYHTQTCPLSKLIPTTHKALTTETYESALLEGKLAVVYSRIEELKRQKKWSLRQPQKYQDPFILHSGSKSHWGNLLDEAKWMATDFKEGRKFKLVQCLFIAQAVSDYWTYGKVMCINRKPIVHLGDKAAESNVAEEGEVTSDNANENAGVDAGINTTAAVSTVEGDGKEAETKEAKSDAASPEKEEAEEEEEKDGEEEDSEESSSSSLEGDDADNEPEEGIDTATEKPEEEPMDESEDNVLDSQEDDPLPDTIDISLLLKRPDPSAEIPIPNLPNFTKDELPKDLQPFKMYVDQNEISPLNRNILESLPSYDLFNDQPEVKENSIVPVSKLLTPLDEDDESWYKVLLKENYFLKGSSHATEKGLFGFSSTKRLTFIRPPIPPPLKYLDLRIPTIWLPEDDKHLIRYVAEFQFNWNIISAHLSAKATKGYVSNIERRTPWQCFERYIQLNDKFQFSDMRGGYTPQAQMWLEAAHKAQSTTKRRISPLGVGNESIQRGHKRLRWASMFEAMRKFMKKRESAPKPNTPHPRRDDKKIAAPTPLDLAKLKYERDQAIQEAYLNQNNANLGMRRTASGQQMGATSQVQLVQRQLAAASSQVNGNGASSILLQQLLVQRLQKQRAAAAAAAAKQQLPGSTAVDLTSQLYLTPVKGAQIQASSAAMQAQQQRLQLQQQQQLLLLQQQLLLLRGAAGPRSNSNPAATVTGPNGQTYTNEQLQHLLQLQKQRQLLLLQQLQQLQQVQQQQQQQQQHKVQLQLLLTLQSAPASTVTSNNGTPIVAGATLSADVSKSMSPNISNSALKTSSGTATPTKNMGASFSNSQVTAIVQQIQSQHPHLNKQQVSRLAASYLHNLSTQQQQQQHRAMSNKVMKVNASNPTTPMQQQPVQLADGSQSLQMPARNLASSLQMLNTAQLTKLASSPTLTPAQRQQILSVQQLRLRSAGQAVMAGNRVGTSSANRTMNPANGNRQVQSVGRGGVSSANIPTPQQLAAQRARLQEQQALLQQQQQQQQHQHGSDGI